MIAFSAYRKAVVRGTNRLPLCETKDRAPNGSGSRSFHFFVASIYWLRPAGKPGLL